MTAEECAGCGYIRDSDRCVGFHNVTEKPEYSVMQILRPQGERIVTIRPDGTIEFGPNYDPDEASRIFWDTISKNMPLLFHCETCSCKGES